MSPSNGTGDPLTRTSPPTIQQPPQPFSYHDGDVLIAVPWGAYQLHSTVLSRCSDRLWTLLAQPTSRSSTFAAAHSERVIKWDLTVERDGSISAIRVGQTGYVGLPLVYDPSFAQRLDCLLRAFYDQPLNHSIDVVLSTIELAEKWFALEAFRQPAIVSLVGDRLKDLMDLVPTDPVKFLAASYKLRSAQLFEEAFIHCAGRYPKICYRAPFKETLPRHIRQALTDEHYRLERLSSQVFLSIVGIQTTEREVRPSGNRVTMVHPDYIPLSIHRVFKWNQLRPRNPESFPGQYDGYVAKTLHDWKVPFPVKAKDGHYLSLVPKPEILRGTADPEKAEIKKLTEPLVKTSKWSNISSKTPYLLCAKVDLKLLER